MPGGRCLADRGPAPCTPKVGRSRVAVGSRWPRPKFVTIVADEQEWCNAFERVLPVHAKLHAKSEIAFIIDRNHISPLAYVAGSLGTLIGADLTRRPPNLSLW